MLRVHVPSRLSVGLCHRAVRCRRRSASVHSKNYIWATASGRSQTHFFIFSAVRLSPQRDSCLSGNFTNGIFERLGPGFSGEYVVAADHEFLATLIRYLRLGQLLQHLRISAGYKANVTFDSAPLGELSNRWILSLVTYRFTQLFGTFLRTVLPFQNCFSYIPF
jgi:hypothetical protein